MMGFGWLWDPKWFWIMLTTGILVYLVGALVLYRIGKKLKTGPYYLAWIPFANLFYLPILAGYEWYFGFLLFAGIIPFIGGFIELFATIYFFGKIVEKFGHNFWESLLIIIPIVNIVWILLVAFDDNHYKLKKQK